MFVTKREGSYTGKLMHECMNECVGHNALLVRFVCVYLKPWHVMSVPALVCVCGFILFVIANSLFRWKKKSIQAQQG